MVKNLYNIKHFFSALRFYQWIKNFLIFLPLVLGGEMLNVLSFKKSVVVFFVFSLAASFIYLLNDMVDLEKDKRHPIKKTRPLASDKLPISIVKRGAFILGSIVLIFSFIFDVRIFFIISIYILLNLIYIFFLKNLFLIDVICLSFSYFLRILSGSIIANITLSKWIVLCVFLLAMFVGFNKRKKDLLLTNETNNPYFKYDVSFLNKIIYTISILVIASYFLYTIEPKVVNRIEGYNMLYTVPFVFYGIFRYLYIVDKKNLGSDPALIFIKDWKMQLNLLLWLIFCILFIYF